MESNYSDLLDKLSDCIQNRVGYCSVVSQKKKTLVFKILDTFQAAGKFLREQINNYLVLIFTLKNGLDARNILVF